VLVLIAIVAPVLLCGGYLWFVSSGLDAPPNLDVLMPLPPSVELLESQTFDERIDGRVWHGRRLMLRSTDGSKGSALVDRVSFDYQNSGVRPHVYQGVDGRLDIEPVPGQADQVRVDYLISG